MKRGRSDCSCRQTAVQRDVGGGSTQGEPPRSFFGGAPALRDRGRVCAGRPGAKRRCPPQVRSQHRGGLASPGLLSVSLALFCCGLRGKRGAVWMVVWRVRVGQCLRTELPGCLAERRLPSSASGAHDRATASRLSHLSRRRNGFGGRSGLFSGSGWARTARSVYPVLSPVLNTGKGSRATA